jgi:hypothetical protein
MVVAAASARFLSSAAFAVARWRRSASDFKFGLGVVATVASGSLSEREQAPPEKAHASKITMRIVFIGKNVLRGLVGSPSIGYIVTAAQATMKANAPMSV